MAGTVMPHQVLHRVIDGGGAFQERPVFRQGQNTEKARLCSTKKVPLGQRL
jgi:hypothetical protein